MPNAPRQSNPIRCRRVIGASFTNQPVTQNAIAAKVQRTVTPVNALIHTGSRNFRAFIFNPANIRETTKLKLASSFLSFIRISQFWFQGRERREKKIVQRAWIFQNYSYL